MSDVIMKCLQCVFNFIVPFKEPVTADWNLVCFTSSPLFLQSEGSGMEYCMTHSSTFSSCFIEDGILARPSSIEKIFDRIQKLQANNVQVKRNFLTKCFKRCGWLVVWFTSGILLIWEVSCSNNDPESDYHELSLFLCC
jgi:hypothetical protein